MSPRWWNGFHGNDLTCFVKIACSKHEKKWNSSLNPMWSLPTANLAYEYLGHGLGKSRSLGNKVYSKQVLWKSQEICIPGTWFLSFICSFSPETPEAVSSLGPDTAPREYDGYHLLVYIMHCITAHLILTRILSMRAVLLGPFYKEALVQIDCAI